jgi:phage terminase Nu1 subunit (DNA packaging protein)
VPKSGLIVNQAELAETFGVSEMAIQDWQKEGLPLLARGMRGQSSQYDTRACIEWYAERRAKSRFGDSSREKLSKVNAERAELKLAEEKGDLVNPAKLRPQMAQSAVAVREGVLQLPDRLRVVSGLDEEQVDRARAECERILRNLSRYEKPGGEVSLLVDGAAESTGEDDSGDMGGDEEEPKPKG